MSKDFKPPAKQEFSVDLMPTSDFVERLMLRKFITDRSYATFVAENLNPAFIDNKTIKSAIDIGVMYLKKYGKTLTIDLIVNIMEKLGQDSEAKMLPSFFNTPVEVDEEYARDTIKAYIQNKSLFNLIYANSDKIMRTRNIYPYINELQRISSIEFNNDIGFDYLEQIEEYIFDLVRPDARVSSGYHDLDVVTNGGFPAKGKCLVVFMAQPGLGKSMMMHNLAVNFLRNGKKVLIISLEMTEQIYASRISANLNDININELILDSNLQKIRDTVSEIKAELPDSYLMIKEFPPASVKPIIIGDYIERLTAAKGKPDMVFVDYLNLMIPNKADRESNSYERIGEICKELRALSYKFEIPFFTATQTNRSGFNNPDVDLSNLSDSSQPGHHSDGIWALVSDGPETGIIRMVTLKNRFGKNGATIKFAVNYDSLRLNLLSNRIDPGDHQVNAVVDEIGNMN
jgi:archaellum biogenesis ATPase FlaH